MDNTGIFTHNVYFWLKNPESSQDATQLEKGIKSLAEVSHIKAFHVGKPASTDRPVIDTTYSFHLMLTFDNKEKHDAYQVDPIHKQFVSDCSDLWEKVQIYDSVSC